MEFIIADKDRKDTGLLTLMRKLDFEIGNDQNCKNDFELKVPNSIDQGGFNQYIYSPGTEYGGRIEEFSANTKEGVSIWRGSAWRGLLRECIIEPPTGLAYLSVSGDANDVIRTVLRGRLGGLFEVDTVSSGLNISYQFDRYTTVLDGLNEMLKEQNYRLKIWTENRRANGEFSLKIGAVARTDYTEEIEYSQDNRINMTITDYRRGINHLICLGSGELTGRMVLHLYADEKGSISENQSISGVNERVGVFDYPNAENEADLRKSGSKKLTELMNFKKMNVAVENVELEVGDVIAGRDRNTDSFLSKPIVQKILRIEGLTEKIEYKVEGE